MSSPAQPPRAERRRFPADRSFALRLRAVHATDAWELAGQLEHVMSGRCTDFAGAAQLLEALAAWPASAPAAAPAPPAPTTFPPQEPTPFRRKDPVR